MGDTTRGIYEKFIVKRIDGTSEAGQRHEKCFYFVLDVDHDPHAIAAIRAYAESCRETYPILAGELTMMIEARVSLAAKGEHKYRTIDGLNLIDKAEPL